MEELEVLRENWLSGMKSQGPTAPYRVNRTAENGSCVVTWALLMCHDKIHKAHPLCLGHNKSSLREHPFRLVMLADRYEQRDGTGVQCAYQCVQYCVDENFENRGMRSMSVGKRQRHRLEIGHADFQKALNAVWAAGKGCRREPMSYNPPEAIRLSLRAEIDARAIVWQPRGVPTHKPNYFHEVVKYFKYDGSWSLTDSTWERDEDRKGHQPIPKLKL